MESIEDLYPEDARAIVDPALKLMIDAVHHFDDYVAQPTSDGIFALFGAPVAHEDQSAAGALHAALRMQREIRRYGDRLLQGGASTYRNSCRHKDPRGRHAPAGPGARQAVETDQGARTPCPPDHLPDSAAELHACCRGLHQRPRPERITWWPPSRRRSDGCFWRCTRGNPPPRSGPNRVDASPRWVCR
jgi:hypothetical protein